MMVQVETRPRAAVKLHTATGGDAAALTTLYRTAWDDAGEDENTVRGWLEQGGTLYFAREDTVVCALRWRETPYGWEVGRLATLPEYRGQGFGRWLMTHLEALAIQHNIPELRLTLSQAQTDLLPYYTRMGYQPRDPETPLTLSKRVGGVWQRQG
jgi:GNAT superfamily N-acetyltransferase